MDEHERLVTELQARIRAEHDRLRSARPGGPEHEAAAQRVIDAASDLLRHEERLPILRDQPRRRLSLLTVRWTGGTAAGLALVLALCTVPGWLPRWSLLVLVPLALLGGRVGVAKVAPAGARHSEQRAGAHLVAAGAVGTALTVLGLVPIWALLPAIGLAAAGAALVEGYPLVRRARR